MIDVDVSTIPDYLALLISGPSTNAGIRSHLVVIAAAPILRRDAWIALKLRVSSIFARPHRARAREHLLVILDRARFAIRTQRGDLRLKK